MDFEAVELQSEPGDADQLRFLIGTYYTRSTGVYSTLKDAQHLRRCASSERGPSDEEIIHRHDEQENFL
ncbi:hypothetical protein OESDEN_02980 [Oesophagostomum dentatum]|uniref:Uncharacterized protein n=1 Tax=Oesophagostomum dentatum TaxID=61180 RepID=A0A0B1TLT4_OESDE|nr:hypothetical protein OESDEN_02980 [Oesophagostomum dentatum]